LNVPLIIEHEPTAGRATYRATEAADGREVCIVDRFSYGRLRLMWYGETSMLRIGRYSSIAPSVTIFIGGDHRTDWVTTYPFHVLAKFWPEAAEIGPSSVSKGDVVIGHDVWIGDNATIMSGVGVGHGAVVGAGTVVTRDVAPYTVVAGNPARIVRQRFSEPDIARLLALGWWDWPDAAVRELMRLLSAGDLPAFFAAAEHKPAMAKRTTGAA
jgi:acetyltransferase-like isoleucine patch superfamily enzyme